MIEIKDELNRYVVATLTENKMYLKYTNGQYGFVNNLIECTKTMQRSLANELKMYFYQDTGLTDIELVVLPLKIEYRLVNELEE